MSFAAIGGQLLVEIMSPITYRALLLGCLLVGTYPAASQLHAQEAPPKTIAQMTQDEQATLVASAQRAIDDSLIGKHFFEDDPLPIRIVVALESERNLIIVGMDERFGPDALDSEMQDFGDHISSVLQPIITSIDGFTGFKFTFGGHDMDYWPDNRAPEPVSTSRRRKRAAEDKPLVIVAPGHGAYYHYGFKDWRAQRETSHDVLEDDLTPVLAGHLTYALSRDGVEAESLRTDAFFSEHKPSGRFWWQMGVRYLLEARFPEMTSVWHSRPTSTKPLRERNEDIRSRPLYANFRGAAALLHIHTNADASPEANGLRTYIAGLKPEDRELASKILCSTRELISTEPDFSSFNVASSPHVEQRHAENKLANMASVIVELGFHTNQGDAALLKDRKFQSLAMRGVAKGYRLFRDKLPCESFEVSSATLVTGRVGYDVKMPFSIKGNPVYPITVWTKQANCTGRFCFSNDRVLSGQRDLDRMRVQYLCKRDDLGKPPVEILVSARDFDRVKTNPVTYKVACTK